MRLVLVLLEHVNAPIAQLARRRQDVHVQPKLQRVRASEYHLPDPCQMSRI